MKFGTQQHIWNSMKLTWLYMKILFLAITQQLIARFQWNFAWEAVFHRISAIKYIPTFHRTERIFVFLMQFWRRRAAVFVSSPIHLFWRVCYVALIFAAQLQQGCIARWEWCLRQTFMSISGLVWPWPLTFDLLAAKLIISCPCRVDHLCRLASKWIHFVFKI